MQSHSQGASDDLDQTQRRPLPDIPQSHSERASDDLDQIQRRPLPDIPQSHSEGARNDLDQIQRRPLPDIPQSGSAATRRHGTPQAATSGSSGSSGSSSPPLSSSEAHVLSEEVETPLTPCPSPAAKEHVYASVSDSDEELPNLDGGDASCRVEGNAAEEEKEEEEEKEGEEGNEEREEGKSTGRARGAEVLPEPHRSSPGPTLRTSPHRSPTSASTVYFSALDLPPAAEECAQAAPPRPTDRNHQPGSVDRLLRMVVPRCWCCSPAAPGSRGCRSLESGLPSRQRAPSTSTPTAPSFSEANGWFPREEFPHPHLNGASPPSSPPPSPSSSSPPSASSSLAAAAGSSCLFPPYDSAAGSGSDCQLPVGLVSGADVTVADGSGADVTVADGRGADVTVADGSGAESPPSPDRARSRQKKNPDAVAQNRSWTGPNHFTPVRHSWACAQVACRVHRNIIHQHAAASVTTTTTSTTTGATTTAPPIDRSNSPASRRSFSTTGSSEDHEYEEYDLSPAGSGSGEQDRSSSSGKGTLALAPALAPALTPATAPAPSAGDGSPADTKPAVCFTPSTLTRPSSPGPRPAGTACLSPVHKCLVALLVVVVLGTAAEVLYLAVQYSAL